MINELWLLGMRQLSFKPSYQHLWPMLIFLDEITWQKGHIPKSSSTKPCY